MHFQVCEVNHAQNVEYVEVVLQDGNSIKNLKLQTVTSTAGARFPCPTGNETKITVGTARMTKRIQISQFPLNIANARTVHKLQGQSLNNLLVSNWSYTPNWI